MKLSLKNKLGIMIVSAALVFTAIAGFLSYHFYSRAMDRHYKTMAMSIAKTAADLVDPVLVQTYQEQVWEIYKKDPAPKWKSEEEKTAYFQQYEKIADRSYQKIIQTLEKIRSANQALSLYLIYVDTNTMTCVYIADPDQSPSACPIGTWDIIYEENYESMKHPENGFPAYITDSEYGWLCSAGAAVMGADGNVIAHAMVDLSMDQIMQDRYHFMIGLILLLAVVTFLFLVLFSWIANQTMVKPINCLSEAAALYVTDREKLAKGEQTAIESLNIHTGDEIELLADSMKQMEKDLSHYIDHLFYITSEKERISTELNVAAQIQASMLPRIFPPFPKRKDINIYALMDPAKEVGGDFYDFFLIDESHLGMVIADVSGKGVPAALFMVIAKTLIKDRTCAGKEPQEVFTWVNQQLCESNEAGLFVTAWLGILDVTNGHLTYVNAGHNPPLVAQNGGDFTYLKQKSGFVLAGIEEFCYKQEELILQPTDRIFLYTDGVTEAMNDEDELYSEERLNKWLNSHKNNSLTEVLHDLREDIRIFSAGTQQHDDITMLLYEVQPFL